MARAKWIFKVSVLKTLAPAGEGCRDRSRIDVPEDQATARDRDRKSMETAKLLSPGPRWAHNERSMHKSDETRILLTSIGPADGLSARLDTFLNRSLALRVEFNYADIDIQRNTTRR